MAIYINNNTASKKEIISVLLVLFIVVFGISMLVKSITRATCGDIYPNPNVGGCGVYSQQDLDEKWCEEKGGRHFGGGVFGSGGCIFPPLINK